MCRIDVSGGNELCKRQPSRTGKNHYRHSRFALRLFFRRPSPYNGGISLGVAEDRGNHCIMAAALVSLLFP